MHSSKTRGLTAVESFPSLTRKSVGRNNSHRIANQPTFSEGRSQLISELEEKIEEQSVELEERNMRVESIVAKVEGLMDALTKEKEASAQYMDLNARLMGKIEQVKLLNGKLNSEIARLNNGEERRQGEIEEIQRENRENYSKVCRELAEKISSMRDLEMSNSLLKGQFSEFEKRVKELESSFYHENKKLGILINGKDELLSSRDNEIELLRGEREKLENKIKELTQSTASEQASRTKTEIELKRANEANSSNESNLKRIISKLNDENRMVTSSREKNKSEYNNICREMQSLKETLIELETVKNRLETDTITDKKTILELSTKLSDRNDYVQELTNRIHILNLEHSHEISEITLKENHSTLMDKIASLKSKLAIHLSQESELIRTRTDLKSLTSAHAALIEKYNGLSSQSASSQDQLNSLQLELSYLTEKKEKDKGFYYSKLNEIKQLKRQITQKDEIISTLQLVDVSKYQSEISNLSTQLNSVNSYTQLLETELSSLKQAFSSQNDIIDTLKSQLLLINESELRRRHDSLQLKESDLQRTLMKLETAVSSMEIELSCTHCLNIMEESKMLLPCGHSFCANCASDSVSTCYECNSPATFSVPSRVIENLCSKLNYQKLAIQSVVN